MKLVIDTNCIISSLIKNGLSRRIIVSPAIQFITPEYTLEELSHHKHMITKKAKITKRRVQYSIKLTF